MQRPLLVVALSLPAANGNVAIGNQHHSDEGCRNEMGAELLRELRVLVAVGWIMIANFVSKIELQ